MSKGPPDKVYSSGQASELSTALEAGRTPWWMAMMVGLVCGLFAVLALAMLLHPPASGPPPMTWIAIFAATLPLGAGCVYYGLKWKDAPVHTPSQATESFSVYSWGLVHQRKQEQVIYHWEDLTEVLVQKNGPLHIYRMATGNGGAFQVGTHIQDASELALHIQTKVGERLLPEYRRRLAQGGELAFGNIGLSKTHLVYKGKRVPWTEFQSVDIEKSVFDPSQLDFVSVKADLPSPSNDSGDALYFTVRRSGKAAEILPYCHVRLGAIPNSGVFAQLLEELPIRRRMVV